jgi:hypothetical protein
LVGPHASPLVALARDLAFMIVLAMAAAAVGYYLDAFVSHLTSSFSYTMAGSGNMGVGKA